MTVTQTLKALRTVAAFAAIVLVGTSSSTRLQAQDDTFRILQGFAIAPVPCLLLLRLLLPERGGAGARSMKDGRVG